MSEFADITSTACLHCKEVRTIRRRGLCGSCYNKKDIRLQYPRTEFAKNDGGWIPAGARTVPGEPTNAEPGSDEKMEVMRQRFENGQHIFHPKDHVLKLQKGTRRRQIESGGLTDHTKKGRTNHD